MVVAPDKKSMNCSSERTRVSSTFQDVSPQDILKNLDIQITEEVSSIKFTESSIDKPSCESISSLVDNLSRHFTKDGSDQRHCRGKSEEEAYHSKLKKTVYSTLLSFRKDCNDSSKPRNGGTCTKVNEVEELLWMTHVFVRQRRFDDANSLSECLDLLRDGGHLEVNNDIRQVLKFLVALKGYGNNQENVNLPAKIIPRIITPATKRPRFLPLSPLNYGDTSYYSAQHQYHYMHYPSDIFKISVESQDQEDAISFPINKILLDLPNAAPGTGINPMIIPKDDSKGSGKVLGALLQKQREEISPEAVLSVPVLPLNPDEYCGFSHLAKAPLLSPYGATCSDEGYDTRPSSRQIPDEDDEDVWEKVMLEPPLTDRRTWENIGHPPIVKEKPFLSEAGSKSAHNIWIMYQELWSHLRDVPESKKLCFIKNDQLCQDILYLLTGVPSVYFPWCNQCQRFIMKEGLCTQGVTPGHIRTALTPVIECANYIRRLEVMCTPSLHSRKLRRKGLVFHAFVNAVANFLHVHRGKVLLLTGEKNFLALLQKIEGLVAKVRFIASLCYISQKYETDCPDRDSICSHDLHSSRPSITHPYNDSISLGLNLIGDLNNLIMVTKNKEYIMLLVYIMRCTCIPFLRYLEEWIYEGICYDPELEFMIDVNNSALLHRDRRYWTHGYTLRDLSTMPYFLQDVLREAFACGKALNLLKLCSPKHYLVSGTVKHPSVELCVSQDQLEKKYEECQAFEVLVDYLAAKNEVSAMQREDLLREEKKQLLAAASKKYADALKLITGRKNAARLKEFNRKQNELKDLKLEMEKASERKKQQIQDEIDLDKKIALEQEELEHRQKENEERVRVKMELYYEQLVKAAEKRETLARWKVERCQLKEVRREFLTTYKWKKNQIENCMNDTLVVANENEGSDVNVRIEVKPLFVEDQNHVVENTYANEALLRIDRDHVDYVEPSPTEESTSGCDMTLSRMSTSSDFVDTPHDENIPDLEIDPVGVRNRPSSYWGNSFIKKKHHSFDPKITDDLIEEQDHMKMVANRNRYRVMREEYEIDMEESKNDSEDANANFSTPDYSKVVEVDDDENGNTGKEGLLKLMEKDVNNLRLDVSEELNSNLTQGRLPAAVFDAALAPVETKARDGANDNNGNMPIARDNDNYDNYKAMRAKAAMIKQKVLGQEYYSTIQETLPNKNQPKRFMSSEALANKQKMMSSEFEMTTYSLESKMASGFISDAKTPQEMTTSTGSSDRQLSPMSTSSYSRQVSATSTSSYKSFHSYDRQTSTSTVFSTPDEEKPILIDQVGGEILKERGRSVHGHASDAVIHKLLWKHEPVSSPTESTAEPSIEETTIIVKSVCEVQPYDQEKFNVPEKQIILDICGSALFGKPSTAENLEAIRAPAPLPSIHELAGFPVNFVRSIRAHLAIQSRLVNSSLLNEVLVQENLLDHFSALRTYLLLHDANFARALILNLNSKVNLCEAPAKILTPVVMNGILSKSISESSLSQSPYADNLSFDVVDTPDAKFTSQTSILKCLELRYRVKWPHSLIMDEDVLSMYSKLWKFLATLHFSIWAADDLFCYTSSISRKDKECNFVRCPQFHQLNLYRHEMHHFLLVIQAYVTNQVHQTSWSDFEQKILSKVSSIDELYVLHSDLVKSIVSRCFLNKNGSAVLKLIQEVFSLMHQFRSQLKSHNWQINTERRTTTHPAFGSLQKTYKDFKKYATFLHKMLLKVVERYQLVHIQDLLCRLDFNDFYFKQFNS